MRRAGLACVINNNASLPPPLPLVLTAPARSLPLPALPRCLLSHTVYYQVSFGTLICITCAAVHRDLGVGVSFVRSLTMDRWSASQLASLQHGGNARMRRYWRSHGLSAARPRDRLRTREARQYTGYISALAALALDEDVDGEGGAGGECLELRPNAELVAKKLFVFAAYEAARGEEERAAGGAAQRCRGAANSVEQTPWRSFGRAMASGQQDSAPSATPSATPSAATDSQTKCVSDTATPSTIGSAASSSRSASCARAPSGSGGAGTAQSGAAADALLGGATAVAVGAAEAASGSEQPARRRRRSFRLYDRC